MKLIEIQKIIISTLIILIINVFLCFELSAKNLSVSHQSAHRGDEVTFIISMNDALNDVKSFGFEIEYSHDSLRFNPDDYEIGELLEQGYGYLTLDKISPGLIRIGWFSMLNYKIPKHANGILVKLKFTVVNCNDTKLKIVSLLDHIESWPLENGQLSILDKDFCRIDIDNDKKLGIQEVIFLMKHLSED